MMKRTHLQGLALAVVLAAVGAAASIARADADAADTTLKEIAGYRQWTRVTKKLLLAEDFSSFAG
jgi:hypothetical protein